MSEVTKLEYLFNLVVERYKKQRKLDPHFDGKAAWQPIKECLTKYDKITRKYKKLNSSLVEEIMKLPEYYIDGHGKQIINESNHFIIQQVRIPMEEANLRKVLQLALNIGQWQGVPNKEVYKKINYPSTKLSELSTYLSKRDIWVLSSTLEDIDLNYLIEYLKVKS